MPENTERNIFEMLLNDADQFGMALLVTLMIAAVAILIGLLIGVICAAVRIAPKTNRLKVKCWGIANQRNPKNKLNLFAAA